MNYAKQRDLNEPEVIEALVAAGAAVEKLNGTGLPDLLVSYRDELFLLEVKRPLGARGGKSQRRECEGGEGDMTAAQVQWWKKWKGKPAIVVRSGIEALVAIGATP